MHNSEWPIEYLNSREVELTQYHEVIVRDERGNGKELVMDAGIAAAYWHGDIVVVEYINGRKTIWYGPSDNQRETY